MLPATGSGGHPADSLEGTRLPEPLLDAFTCSIAKTDLNGVRPAVAVVVVVVVVAVIVVVVVVAAAAVAVVSKIRRIIKVILEKERSWSPTAELLTRFQTIRNHYRNSSPKAKVVHCCINKIVHCKSDIKIAAQPI
ncbi:hypothetical protein ElyMa_005873900 [Elysia marginata]|uniref:Uncharacterized protein n=1 Tax=Elysia marginata TaxID=1093978 RepID=A0AAV4G125_9GAST|nr:hypothetical protein ElyMa_005873900 [Elysia marginata]